MTPFTPEKWLNWIISEDSHAPDRAMSKSVAPAARETSSGIHSDQKLKLLEQRLHGTCNIYSNHADLPKILRFDDHSQVCQSITCLHNTLNHQSQICMQVTDFCSLKLNVTFPTRPLLPSQAPLTSPITQVGIKSALIWLEQSKAPIRFVKVQSIINRLHPSKAEVSNWKAPFTGHCQRHCWLVVYWSFQSIHYRVTCRSPWKVSLRHSPFPLQQYICQILMRRAVAMTLASWQSQKQDQAKEPS